MKKNLITFLLFAALAVPILAKAQFYRIRSAEGKKVRVHVEDLPRQLRISCLQDTLLLYDLFGDYHVRVLDSTFLAIRYAVRGGSGYGPEYTAILAVKDGRLYKALLLESSFETVGPQYHQTLHTDIQLAGNQWNNYVLTLDASKYLRDESHPSGTHKHFPPAWLPFNKEEMAFYGKTVIADSIFTAMENNQNIEYIHFATGDTLVTVELAGDIYYFAEGSWYRPIHEQPLSQQDTALQKLLTLPIVVQKSAWIDSVTRHGHGISLMMLETANWPSDTGRYVLQAGYHRGQTFDPFYLFTVYQPNLAIKTATPPKQPTPTK